MPRLCETVLSRAMKVHYHKAIQIIPASLQECWNFFSTPVNLGKITPPSMDFRILSQTEPEIYPGQIIIYLVKPAFGIPVTWVTEITYVKKFAYFSDVQRIGPYKFWHHRHLFHEVPGGVEMRDIVCYALPYGSLGQISRPFVRKRLQEIFDYRRERIGEIFR